MATLIDEAIGSNRAAALAGSVTPARFRAGEALGFEDEEEAEAEEELGDGDEFEDEDEFDDEDESFFEDDEEDDEF